MVMLPQSVIHHYQYMITPPLKSLQEEHEALTRMWSQLQGLLQNFVVRCPNHIYSTTHIPHEKKFPWTDSAGGLHEVVMKHWRQYTAAQINGGQANEVGIVF